MDDSSYQVTTWERKIFYATLIKKKDAAIQTEGIVATLVLVRNI